MVTYTCDKASDVENQALRASSAENDDGEAAGYFCGCYCPMAPFVLTCIILSINIWNVLCIFALWIVYGLDTEQYAALGKATLCVGVPLVFVLALLTYLESVLARHYWKYPNSRGTAANMISVNFSLVVYLVSNVLAIPCCVAFALLLIEYQTYDLPLEQARISIAYIAVLCLIWSCSVVQGGMALSRASHAHEAIKRQTKQTVKPSTTQLLSMLFQNDISPPYEWHTEEVEEEGEVEEEEEKKLGPSILNNPSTSVS